MTKEEIARRIESIWFATEHRMTRKEASVAWADLLFDLHGTPEDSYALESSVMWLCPGCHRSCTTENASDAGTLCPICKKERSPKSRGQQIAEKYIRCKNPDRPFLSFVADASLAGEVDAAIAEEREACAKIVQDDDGKCACARCAGSRSAIANAIRARNTQK